MNKKILPTSIIMHLGSLSLLAVMTFFSVYPKSSNISYVKLRAPTPPQKLEAIPSNKKVILIWYTPISNNGTQINEYIVYRKFYFGSYSEIGRSNSMTLSYVDSNLTSNIDFYYYTVCAKTPNSESKHSNEVIVFPFIDSVQVSDTF